jgi:hypothetical protein
MSSSNETAMVLLVAILVVIGVVCLIKKGDSQKGNEKYYPAAMTEAQVQEAISGNPAYFRQEDSQVTPIPGGGGVGGPPYYAPWSKSDPLLGAGSGTYGRMRVEGPLEY